MRNSLMFDNGVLKKLGKTNKQKMRKSLVFDKKLK